ncbi:MAG: hypothetical protein AMS25_14170 [Gemmatimonas sp. SM23_52]|nr:MAG: hypothetical protein AMS25_14170 [Gemmatimonas sp. SM23_52]
MKTPIRDRGLLLVERPRAADAARATSASGSSAPARPAARRSRPASIPRRMTDAGCRGPRLRAGSGPGERGLVLER